MQRGWKETGKQDNDQIGHEEEKRGKKIERSSKGPLSEEVMIDLSSKNNSIINNRGTFGYVGPSYLGLELNNVRETRYRRY